VKPHDQQIIPRWISLFVLPLQTVIPLSVRYITIKSDEGAPPSATPGWEFSVRTMWSAGKGYSFLIGRDRQERYRYIYISIKKYGDT
jgi:hypothetical protein